VIETINIGDETMNTIKHGKYIIAKVTIMGGVWGGTGWRYTQYKADRKLKSGYRFDDEVSGGMYPNKSNHTISASMEETWKTNGLFIADGRPVAGFNAPIVK